MLRPFHLMRVMPPEGVIPERKPERTLQAALSVRLFFHGQLPGISFAKEGENAAGVPAAIRRERAEGERPGPGPHTQRWEAVFRRERRPVSLDRISRGGETAQPYKGKPLRFSPCNF